MSIKKSSDTIRNRTCNLPAYSAVPQPTAPPRAPGTAYLHSSTINAILSYSLLSPSNKIILSIPGFRLKEDEICGLLRYYAEYSSNSLQKFHGHRSFKRRYFVSKRRQGITAIRCVMSQKSSDLKTLLHFPQIFY